MHKIIILIAIIMLMGAGCEYDNSDYIIRNGWIEYKYVAVESEEECLEGDNGWVWRDEECISEIKQIVGDGEGIFSTTTLTQNDGIYEFVPTRRTKEIKILHKLITEETIIE